MVAAALADLAAAAARAAPEMMRFWCLVITIRQKAAGERAVMLVMASVAAAGAEALVEWVSTAAQAQAEEAEARVAEAARVAMAAERPSA